MVLVLLVDDHTYIRNGICYLIEGTTDIEVVATASNGIEAVAKARLINLMWSLSISQCRSWME